jgi:hypothetical protein
MKITRPGIIFSAVLAAAACVIPIYVDDGGRFTRPFSTFLKTIEFAPGGIISIDNALGDIVIRGWDKNEIEITAEEDWDESAGRTVRLSGRNRVVPRVEVETKDKYVKIRSRPRDADLEDDRAVRLVIQVPHEVDLQDVHGRRGRITVSDLYGRVRLDLEEGDVRVDNFSGSLDVDLVRGSIQVEILDLRSADTVRLALKQGPATVLIEPGFNGRIEANAPNGTLRCDFIIDPPAESRGAAGKIGTGEGALIIVSSLNGDVRIHKTK